MVRIARLHQLVEDHGQAVIADGQPLTVDVIGGAEHLLFEVSSQPGHEGLMLGAPGRQGIDPHGHTRVAAVLAGEPRLPIAVMRVVHEADEAVMAGEGVGHA
jgi:hypothetical protein